MSDYVLLADPRYTTMPPTDAGLLNSEQLVALRAAPLTVKRPNRVHYALALAGLKQVDVERVTGISHSQLSRIVNGHTGRCGHVELHLAVRLAKHFGCDVDDLFPLSAAR